MKRKKVIFIATTLIIIFMNFYTYNHKSLFYDNLDDINEEIISYENSEASEYIDIQMDEPYIIYNKTTKEHFTDNDFCNMMYKLRLENKTKKNIKLDVKVFSSPELSKDNIEMDKVIFFETDEQLIIEPKKGWNRSSGVLLMHTDNMTDEERVLLDSLKNMLYFQVHINDKYYFFKYENKKQIK